MSFPRVTRRLPEQVCLFLIVQVLVLALTAGAAAPAGAGAGDDPDATPSPSTTAFADGDDDGEQRIIPRPDSGHEPTEAGDRGGALQLALLALILVGVGFVGWRVSRSVFDLPEPSGRSKTEEHR